MVKTILLGLAAVRGANVASLCTTNLQQLNCQTEYRVESDERVCGNDGVTYTNLCVGLNNAAGKKV